jgi:hypothetical protein
MTKRTQSQADTLFPSWFESKNTTNKSLVVMEERPGGREAVFEAFVNTVSDHFVDLAIIEKMGGFSKSAHVLRNRLPVSKKTRSGDLGEIVATEFVARTTDFSVPIRRLRFKDDRDLAMRGDDVLGFRRDQSTTNVIKVEAKSRISLSKSVIREARVGLAKRDGRPNPSTLAFIEYILRRENRDGEAELIAQLQNLTIQANNITHLVFTLSENDPSTLLSSNSDQVVEGISLHLCGCKVNGHADFVRSVFESCLALGASHGNS